ncbi:MAG: hypothetical protein J5879_10180 [Clostridia bacterium]|nr:hypothetical protein [Clostridia bacterium]
MNTYDVLYGIEYIDADLIAKAEGYGKKRKKSLIIKGTSVAVAACLTVAAGAVGIHVQNSISVKDRDISKRFGVFAANNTENIINQKNTVNARRKPDYYFVEDILTLNEYTVVYGTAKNIETFKTYSPGITWYIILFDIEIIKPINNAPENNIIKACAVTFKSSEISGYPKASINLDIINNPTSLFVLNNNKTPENTQWKMLDYRTIGETDIQTFDYADYYLNLQCKTSNDTARIYDSYLTLDELEEFSISGMPSEKDFYDISSSRYNTIKLH